MWLFVVTRWFVILRSSFPRSQKQSWQFKTGPTVKSLPVLKEAFFNTLGVWICRWQLGMERKNKGRKDGRKRKKWKGTGHVLNTGGHTVPRWGQFPSRICAPSQGHCGFVAILQLSAYVALRAAFPTFLKAGSQITSWYFQGLFQSSLSLFKIKLTQLYALQYGKGRTSATSRSCFDTWLSWMKHIQPPVSSCPSQAGTAMMVFSPNNSPSFDRQVVVWFVFKRNKYQRVAFHCKGISSMRNGPLVFSVLLVGATCEIFILRVCAVSWGSGKAGAEELLEDFPLSHSGISFLCHTALLFTHVCWELVRGSQKREFSKQNKHVPWWKAEGKEIKQRDGFHSDRYLCECQRTFNLHQ